jgi:hypothetical protein
MLSWHENHQRSSSLSSWSIKIGQSACDIFTTMCIFSCFIFLQYGCGTYCNTMSTYTRPGWGSFGRTAVSFQTARNEDEDHVDKIGRGWMCSHPQRSPFHSRHRRSCPSERSVRSSRPRSYRPRPSHLRCLRSPHHHPLHFAVVHLIVIAPITGLVDGTDKHARMCGHSACVAAVALT